MACGCNKNKQRTNSQLAREARRAAEQRMTDRTVVREMERQEALIAQEAQDAKVPAPANR